MSEKKETLVLGPAATADPVERLTTLIDAILQRLPGPPPHRAEVAPRDGGRLPRIRVDLTGTAVNSHEDFAALEELDDDLPEGMELTDRFDSVHGTPGTIDELRVEAYPLLVFGAPIDLELQLLQVPIVWVEDVEGRLGLVGDEDRQPSEASGRVRLSIDKEAAINAAQPALDQLLAEAELPFEIEILQIQLAQDGENRIRLQALARASRGILSAKARAAAVVEIDSDLVLHVRDIEVTSRNLVIAAGLKRLESRMTVPPIPLRDARRLGAGLERVTLAVGERIELEAIFC